ncbi:MAG: hypothetical protein FWG71_07360 [Synergistaceae bacterium]|nr:hypothetical protein [Synergistaceae bacterium]
MERVWQDEEIVILKHLARLVGLFLERQKYASALDRRCRKLGIKVK